MPAALILVLTGFGDREQGSWCPAAQGPIAHFRLLNESILYAYLLSLSFFGKDHGLEQQMPRGLRLSEWLLRVLLLFPLQRQA